MKVLDLVVFLAEAKGVPRKEAKQQAGAWLERLGLSDWMQKRVNDLSKGMQQKVQFISTVLHGPDLLILDEPFSGFDPVNTQLMKDVVIELSRGGTTVLFSTHIMEQAEKLCDSVCIIALGQKVLDGSMAEVKRRHGGRHVILAVDDGGTAMQRILADRSLVRKADEYRKYAEIELAPNADPQRLLEEVVRSGARVSRFEIAEPTLHKIFVDLVGPEAAQAKAKGDSTDA
jgi:ABC-2 type transport system ATP-binding protein